MAYLKINWAVNKTGVEEIDFEDLFLTEEEWNEMSSEEQETYVLELLEAEDLIAYPTVTEWTVVTDED